MRSAERQTDYRLGPLWVGGTLAGVGALLLGWALTVLGAWGPASVGLALSAFGFGPLLQALQGLGLLPLVRAMGETTAASPGALLWAGAGLWLLGWGVVAAGIRHRPREEAPSPAQGAPLHGRLQAERDFSWATLLTYGGGILAAELTVVLLQTALSAGVRLTEAAERSGPFSLPPAGAFLVALLAGMGVAFLAGALGAARARRLAAPEATLGILYLGLPLPIFFTLLHAIPSLSITFGPRLREVTYVAGLLGRPELGYWLVFTGLVLTLVLGITVGFVLAGSGRVDARMGYELFVARRHLEVFRPRFLLKLLGVLLLGILPPIVLFAVVRAAQAAVERTRIRMLGLQDPLKAAEALHRLKAKEQSPTQTMTTLSVGGVGVGVMALIIVMSVMSGFEGDLQDKILGINAHAVVYSYEGEIEPYEGVLGDIRKVPGVAAATPFIMNEVMVASEGNVSGAIIKGVDPATVTTVTSLDRDIVPRDAIQHLAHPEEILHRGDALGGAVAGPEAAGEGHGLPESLQDDPIIELPRGEAPGAAAPLPGILLGSELAHSLKVVVGDRVSVVSPLAGGLGPQGPIPRSAAFRVAGVFHTGMYEYDSKFVYILLQEAQRFFNVKGALGVELKVDDVDDARRISRRVLTALEGYPYRVKDWGEMNQNLFAALRLEKLVMAIILSIISIVAAGLIVATVTMLVLEKRKEISVLKALGVPDGGILKIFLAEGLQIGVAGGALGLGAGLAWCWFIAKVGIKLDPEVYYIPSLPVRIEWGQTALAVVIAVLVSFFASIYPALKASRVEPVEGLKAE
ncbi:MAG: ABC transporter permease [Myxococcaceae bacterium]|nr:ABC transporter permease [Myxococcaceae bacterium]MCI0671791.1 ABC transporter permease [Myxococcaceae bacterium]